MAAALAIAGCGDNPPGDAPFVAVSGERLALYWYGYNDGTRTPENAEFYDKVQHARCRPQRWFDGVLRCVPLADEAGYRDAACTEPIGRALTIGAPTHFLEYGIIDDVSRPLRVHVAGERTMIPTRYYRRQRLGGACEGPFSDPPDTPYFTITASLDGSALVELEEAEVGDGRLALRLRTSDDGLQVPLAVLDRTLESACEPTLHRDGRTFCEPTAAANADHFRDPNCTEPVVLVSPLAAVPVIARVEEPSGCNGFRRVGAETTGALYERAGDACQAVPMSPGWRIFTTALPVSPVELERTHDVVAGRRLQRIELSDGELSFYDPRLHDTAIRADCRSLHLGNDARCVPAVTVQALQLFTTSSCTFDVAAAAVPVRSCARPAFAVGNTGESVALHAIGDPMNADLHFFNGIVCLPYVPAPGHVVHRLGPPIDVNAFAAAKYYGER